MISLSLLLFAAEIGNYFVHVFMVICSYFSALFTSSMVLSYFPNTAATQTHIDSAGLFTVMAVTLWTTTLIAYRIYSLSNNVLNREKSRLYKILELITQSASIYSLALIADAVLGTIPQKQSNVWILSMVSSYVGVIVSAITVCKSIYYHCNILFVTRCIMFRESHLPSWRLKLPWHQRFPQVPNQR